MDVNNPPTMSNQTFYIDESIAAGGLVGYPMNGADVDEVTTDIDLQNKTT